MAKTKSKPAPKPKISKAAAKYIQTAQPTGVMPKPTPPLSSADARRQLRGI